MPLNIADLQAQGTGLFRRGVDEAAGAAVPAPAPASSKPRPPKPNRFPGKCQVCFQTVEAEKGKLGAKVDGKWGVAHLEGQCPEATLFDPDTLRTGDDYPHAVWPGIYTVENETGHHTFEVVRQADDDKFAPGEVVISFLSGQDNQSDYTACAFLNGNRLTVWKRFRDNEQLVADLHTLVEDPGSVLTAKHCLRCGDLLSNPVSIAAGLGPVCITKGW